MAAPTSCPACQADLPAQSRFCPSCGAALAPSGTVEMFTRQPSPETRELLARHGEQPRASIHQIHRRPLGAAPPAFLGALSVVALVIALILAVTGSWIGAIIALGVFIGLITLFVPAVRHDPDSRAAITARQSANHAQSTARFIAVAARTWAGAGAALLDIKQRRLRAKRALHSQFAPLGEAVHRGEQARAGELKAHADQLERQLDEMDHDAKTILDSAREAIQREKTTAQPTQAMPTSESETAPARGEGQHRPESQPTPRSGPSPAQPPRRKRRAPLPQ